MRFRTDSESVGTVISERAATLNAAAVVRTPEVLQLLVRLHSPFSSHQCTAALSADLVDEQIKRLLPSVKQACQSPASSVSSAERCVAVFR